MLGIDKALDCDTPIALLARFPSFCTRDPEEAMDCGTRAFHQNRLEVRRSADFFARHNMAAMGRLSFSYFEYRSEVSLFAPEMKRFYLLQIPISGVLRLSVGGREVLLAPGQATMLNPTRAVRLDWADSSQLVVRIDRAALEGALARDLPAYASGILEFNETVLPPPERVLAVRELARMACRHVELAASPLMQPASQRQLVDLLLTNILYTFPHNFSDRLAPSPANVAPRYVKRVEEFILANARRAIGIDDLVVVAGVSERSLQYGFRRFRGIGPMSMLKAVRLDRVRAELLGDLEPGRTVTEVAMKWGFSHHGNFAREYRRCFGENPSATLRR